MFICVFQCLDECITFDVLYHDVSEKNKLFENGLKYNLIVVPIPDEVCIAHMRFNKTDIHNKKKYTINIDAKIAQKHIYLCLLFKSYFIFFF